MKLGRRQALLTTHWTAAQGAAVLQLFPFGWMKEDGTPHREEIYLNMVAAANCSYTRWSNKRADYAYLRKCGLTPQYPTLYPASPPRYPGP